MMAEPNPRARGRAVSGGTALLGTICVLVASLGAWLFWAEVEAVTRAEGALLPAGETQMLYAPTDGVLREILVQSGDNVTAGAPLFRLDPRLSDARFEAEQAKARALEARLARLDAEISQTELVFSEALIEAATAQVAAEHELYAGRAARLGEERATIARKLDENAFEFALHAARHESLLRAITWLESEMAVYEPLVARGIEPQTSMLQRERERENLRGEVEVSAAQMALSQAARRSLEGEAVALEARYRAENLDLRAESQAELSALRATLPALEGLREDSVMRAPRRGVINKLHRTSLGGAVRAGEILAELVPSDDPLRVRAYVRPQDIAFLFLGQRAALKLSAYDYTRYGTLSGAIVQIGSDVVMRADARDQAGYEIWLEVSGALVDRDGAPVALRAGMTVEVDILGEKRRLIDYLLAPVARLRARAFRE